MRAALFLAFLLAGCSTTSNPAPPPAPAGTIQFPDDTLQWTAGAPTLPPGTQIAVLEGSPAKEGFFTMRIRVPKGAALAPHWHPREERVTVLSGKVRVGFGDAADRNATRLFSDGGFYVNPAESHHYLFFDSDSVLQITGIGPWQIHFVEDGN